MASGCEMETLRPPPGDGGRSVDRIGTLFVAINCAVFATFLLARRLVSRIVGRATFRSRPRLAALANGFLDERPAVGRTPLCAMRISAVDFPGGEFPLEKAQRNITRSHKATEERLVTAACCLCGSAAPCEIKPSVRFRRRVILADVCVPPHSCTVARSRVTMAAYRPRCSSPHDERRNKRINASRNKPGWFASLDSVCSRPRYPNRSVDRIGALFVATEWVVLGALLVPS